MSNTVRPSGSVKHTVIEEGSEFKGSLTSSCPIDVRGKIEGEVATPALTVSRSGSVHGRAKVGSVRSEGELSGEFDAETIELAGSVRDNTVIRARSLEVKIASDRGKLQVTFGECELSIGDEPTEHDRVDPPVQTVVQPQVEASLALVAETGAVADLPAVPSAKPETEDEGEGEDEGEDEGETAQTADGAQGPSAGKRRRKRKDVVAEEPEMRWSHPPSQPPPAN